MRTQTPAARSEFRTPVRSYTKGYQYRLKTIVLRVTRMNDTTVGGQTHHTASNRASSRPKYDDTACTSSCLTAFSNLRRLAGGKRSHLASQPAAISPLFTIVRRFFRLTSACFRIASAHRAEGRIIVLREAWDHGGRAQLRRLTSTVDVWRRNCGATTCYHFRSTRSRRVTAPRVMLR